MFFQHNFTLEHSFCTKDLTHKNYTSVPHTFLEIPSALPISISLFPSLSFIQMCVLCLHLSCTLSFFYSFSHCTFPLLPLPLPSLTLSFYLGYLPFLSISLTLTVEQFEINEKLVILTFTGKDLSSFLRLYFA